MNLGRKVLESRSAETVMEWRFIQRALPEFQLKGEKDIFFSWDLNLKNVERKKMYFFPRICACCYFQRKFPCVLKY